MINLDNLRDVLTGISFKDPGMGVGFDYDKRFKGCDWPEKALTMIGTLRMNNIRTLLEDVLENNVDGDVIETGVWRGGACIFMAAILQNYNSCKNVWVCDSFEGLPPPDPDYELDKNDIGHTLKQLAISLEQVRENFKTHNLLSENVKFVKGFFKDTLPNLQAEKFSLLRLDGDMYGSTIEALNALYPKLSLGGYIIIDDYALIGTRTAVSEYRKIHNITSPIEIVDDTGVYWKKSI